MNPALNRIIRPTNADMVVSGYSGFDWSFGLKKKKETPDQKQDKADAKQEKAFKAATKRAELDLQAKGTLITHKESEAKKKNMMVVTVLALVTLAAIGGSVYLLKKKRGKRK